MTYATSHFGMAPPYIAQHMEGVIPNSSLVTSDTDIPCCNNCAARFEQIVLMTKDELSKQ